MKVLLKDFSKLKLNSSGFSGTFGRSEKTKTFLGTIDKYFFNKILPASWRYIVYGHAIK
jgi:hypothetical protein